jgi:hypothetical protein
MTLRFAAFPARTLLAGLLALGAAGAVQAQTTETPMQPEQQAPGSQVTQFSEQELESFVAATVKVREIGARWEPQIQGATDEQAAMELRSQANAEMAAAVEEEGLTPEQYREIYMAALADPELNNRLAQIYEESQGQ